MDDSKLTPEDKQLAEKLGIAGSSETEQAFYLQKFQEALELRVGMVLEDTLSDAQVAEFETVSKQGGDAFGWLKQAVPDFDAIVAREQAALLEEIKQDTDKAQAILSKKAKGDKA
jgi:hypothetical protein